MSECMHVYATINDYHSQCRRCGVVITNPCRFPDCEKIRRELAELREEQERRETWIVGLAQLTNVTPKDLVLKLSELEIERGNWEATAAQYARNAEFYSGLLDECAKHLGPGVFVSDDGSVQDEPLALKIPTLVAELEQQLSALREAVGKMANAYANVKLFETMPAKEALEAKVREVITLFKQGVSDEESG